MKSIIISSAVGIIVGGISACGGAAPTIAPQVQRGEGDPGTASKVLALSASCGSVEFRCPRTYIATVNSIVRSEMDFAGHALVEPDTLRNQTRQRNETHSREITNETIESSSKEIRTLAFDKNFQSQKDVRREVETSVVVLDGPGFDDLTVPERRAVLAEAGADAVLNVRVVVGAAVGNWSPDQNVEVMVKLSVDSGETMAWASRCSASSNDFSTVSSALENAARCAVQGGAKRK